VAGRGMPTSRGLLPASLAAKFLPSEFVETTTAGGVFTLFGYIVVLTLFVIELLSFLRTTHSSTLSFSTYGSTTLQINFDIDVYDIECKNLQMVVIDELDNALVKPLHNSYTLKTLHGKNSHPSKNVTQINKTSGPDDESEEAVHTRVHQNLEKKDGKEELDADWASSHDGFQHQHFDHVIKYHDFTLVNFFAQWCSHCRQFSPDWAKLAQGVNEKPINDGPEGVTGKDREVRAVKMNCVDFHKTCREQGIDAYPTIRLYKIDGSFTRYEGHRSVADIRSWVETTVRAKATFWAAHHEELETGCSARGYLRVPRTPGHIELWTGGSDEDLNPFMTNVSHFVRHLSFSEPDDTYFGGMRSMFSFIMRAPLSGGFPFESLSKLSPIDNREFCTYEFHQAFEHHLSLVGTVSRGGKFTYQVSHFSRIASTEQNVVPQVRFYFDIDPFAIVVEQDGKSWRDFCTSTLAITGGAFVMVKMLAMSSRAAAKAAMNSQRPQTRRPGC